MVLDTKGNRVRVINQQKIVCFRIEFESVCDENQCSNFINWCGVTRSILTQEDRIIGGDLDVMTIIEDTVTNHERINQSLDV